MLRLAATLLLVAPWLPARAQDGAPPPSGPGSYARLLSMPDVSAVGSAAAAWNDYDVATRSPRSGPSAPPNALAFRFLELELALRAVVDPYASAEVYLSFHPGGADVEEAFVSTTSLPAGLQARAGQLRAPFGRVNGQHPHTWDFVDGPLAASRLLADDALAGPGVELSWLAPLPWFAELRLAALTLAPVDGEDGRLTAVARLAQFFPVGEETTLGVGLSGALRDEPAGDLRELFGGDLHLRWRHAATRSSVTLQAELLGRRFRDLGGRPVLGGWAQLFWRVGEHAGLGARYDDASVAGVDGRERRGSAVGTWYLSEFQRLRLQLSHDVRPGGRTGAEALLALEFGIGAHGAHPY